MPITIYINETSQVERLINWGVRAATSEQHDLLVIVPRRQKGAPKWDPLLKEEAEEHEIFKADVGVRKWHLSHPSAQYTTSQVLKAKLRVRFWLRQLHPQNPPAPSSYGSAPGNDASCQPVVAKKVGLSSSTRARPDFLPCDPPI